MSQNQHKGFFAHPGRRVSLLLTLLSLTALTTAGCSSNNSQETLPSGMAVTPKQSSAQVAAETQRRQEIIDRRKNAGYP